MSDSLGPHESHRAGTLGVPLRGPRRVGGLLGVAGTLSGIVSPFRAEQGTSLETPSSFLEGHLPGHRSGSLALSAFPGPPVAASKLPVLHPERVNIIIVILY